MGTVLLVCTGNICRSPMASGFLTALLRDHGVEGVRVESCGVSGWEGSPATPEAVEAMRERGLDISRHVARKMTRGIIESADLIVGMASEHRDAVIRTARPAAERTFTLKELVHLLDSAGPLPRESSSEARLRSAAVRANAVRDAYPDRDLADEDVADPLGLGLESFRAVAWEIGGLCEGLVDTVFGAAYSPMRQDAQDGWGVEGRSEGEGGVP
jgi:protein-tyrosine phosphatase